MILLLFVTKLHRFSVILKNVTFWRFDKICHVTLRDAKKKISVFALAELTCTLILICARAYYPRVS